MKKIFIIMIALATLSIAPKVVAQELTPERGDWALGTDILPLVNTLGHVFSNNTNNTGFGGNAGWFNNSIGTINNIRPNASLMGKYMLTNKIALRANIGVNFGSTITKNLVTDFAALQLDPNSTTQVNNKLNAKINGFNVALGGEYRIGKKRIQGVFGADIILGYYSAVNKYTYGNGLSALYGIGNALDAISGNIPPTASINSGINSGQPMRILQQNTGNIFQIGANVSAGIEVFVAPKIALGGQVNLSYVANIGGKTHTTGEYFDANTESVKQWTNITSPTTTVQTFSTNNIGGALYMMFYFNGK